MDDESGRSWRACQTGADVGSRPAGAGPPLSARSVEGLSALLSDFGAP